MDEPVVQSIFGPVRRRNTPTGSRPDTIEWEKAQYEKKMAARKQRAGEDVAVEDPGKGFGVMDILRILGGLVLLSSALSWFITGESVLWGYKPWFSQWGQVQSWIVSCLLSRDMSLWDGTNGLQRGPLYLTDLELAAYDGTDPKLPIYVGLNGSIYDVSASRTTYGPGGSYGFFAGKDAARAFLTGCFDEDLTPDMRGVEDMYIPVESESSKSLSKGQLKIKRERERRVAKKKVKNGIEGWEKVFRGETGRPYFWVGKIKREEGWLEKLPQRKLCKAAEDGRPTEEDVTT